ncbi:MAG: hypothetical protein ACYC96_15345 [Fimbriimonadaceae bacterium]
MQDGARVQGDHVGTVEQKIVEHQRRKGAFAAGLFDPNAKSPLKLSEADLDVLFAPTVAKPIQ